MSKRIPLFAASLAVSVAACAPGEKLPAAPEVQVSAPAVKTPAKTDPLVRADAAPTQNPRAPAQALAAAPKPPTQTLPQSRPVTPLTAARPEAPSATVITRSIPTPVEPTIVDVLPSAPALKAEREPTAIPVVPQVAATSATTQLRTNLARPPARTELERLNPGMPRLVGPAPRAQGFIARPRVKPTRSTPQVNQVPDNGFSFSNTPSPAGYSASLTTPSSIEYNIPHIPQEEPLWCWAAAAQQAIGWVNNGRAPAQCAIVAMAHGIGVEECCNDREGVCARTGEIPAIAKLVRQFGGQAAETATVPRKPQEVYDILQTGATLLIRIRPAPHDAAVGIRHMIVVRGIEWLRLPNGRLEATLFYNDPLGSGYRSVSFDEIEGFFEQALIVRRSI